MVESTRFKTLEDHRKHQEPKWQEVMDDVKSIQLQVKEEMAGRDQRMDLIVIGMEQKFKALSSMMKTLLVKEKSMNGEAKMGRDRTPLLPTPPSH